MRVTYAHTYKADSDALRFTAVQGGSVITADGFTVASVRLLDVTSPGSPVAVYGDCAGAEEWRLRYLGNASGYVCYAASFRGQPDSCQADQCRGQQDIQLASGHTRR